MGFFELVTGHIMSAGEEASPGPNGALPSADRIPNPPPDEYVPGQLPTLYCTVVPVAAISVAFRLYPDGTISWTYIFWPADSAFVAFKVTVVPEQDAPATV